MNPCCEHRTMLTFSVFIPAYNAASWIVPCLESIFRQDYPREGIEAIVVDGGSSDGTQELVRAFPGAVLLDNPKKLAHHAFTIFAQACRGDLVVMFAADNALGIPDWFKTVNACFMAEPELGAVWGPQVAASDDPPINHYFTLIQNEPLSFFVNKNLTDYIRHGRRATFHGREAIFFPVERDKPLVWGANGLVLRFAWVKEYFISDHFVGDNDIFQNMVEAGHRLTAWIPELHTIHHHVTSLAMWRGKFQRNFQKHFLEQQTHRNMGWAFPPDSMHRLFLWAIYAGIPLFSGVHSIGLMIRDKNWHWLYHPVVNFMQFWTYLTVSVASPHGRAMLKRLLLGA